ncbi:MAG: DNA polymerase III subunit beta [Nitrosomonas sp.]|nr:DNA polymerase III subunit beta [Nitrosomonas sp.]
MNLINTKRDTLLKPLQIVSGIVEQKRTLPILANVLIRKEAEKFFFVTTDLEVEIEVHSIDNENLDKENFSITVSARKFLDILRAFSADTNVIINKTDNRLQVNISKSRFNLQILPIEDFPRMAVEGKPEISLTLSQKDLKKCLYRVQYAMAQQDIRYYLNGLLLLTGDQHLKAVATDGHRLGFISTQAGAELVKKEIILPRKTVHELVKLLEDSDKSVTIDFYPKKISFSFSDIILTSKVIDGKFPDFDRVIPKNNTKDFIIKRLDFLQALQRAAILSNTNDKFRGVKFVISNNRLSILCKNSEQEEAQEDLDIDYNSQETVEISFNITYLLDVLNNLDTETIQCSFENANNGMLITIPSDETFKYVVMPMRL